jgi:hypothetical protein
MRASRIVLGRAGLLDEAHAAVHLHAEGAGLHAHVGGPGLGDGTNSSSRRLKRSRSTGSSADRAMSAATAVSRQMARRLDLAFIRLSMRRTSGWSKIGAPGWPVQAERPCRRSRA